jgi:hypothetical protein
VSRRRVHVRSPVKVTVPARREPPPTSRARFPFAATITRRDGRTYEVEVTERGMRFVGWLRAHPRHAPQGATGAPHTAPQSVDGTNPVAPFSGGKSCP